MKFLFKNIGFILLLNILFSSEKSLKDIPVSIHIGHVVNNEKNGTSCASVVQKNNFFDNILKVNLINFLDKYKFFLISFSAFFYLYKYLISISKKVNQIYENEIFTILAESDFVFKENQAKDGTSNEKVFEKYSKYEYLILISNLKKELKSLFSLNFPFFFNFLLIPFGNMWYVFSNKETVLKRLNFLINKIIN